AEDGIRAYKVTGVQTCALPISVIPAEASAKISFRLVGGQEPDKIRRAFRDYVTARLPGDCKAEFGEHSSAPAIALDWNMKPLARSEERRVGKVSMTRRRVYH